MQHRVYNEKYVPKILYFGTIKPFYNRKLFAEANDDKNCYDVRLDPELAKILHMYARYIRRYFYNYVFELIDEKEAASICKSIEGGLVIKPVMGRKGGADAWIIEAKEEKKESLQALELFLTISDFIYGQNGIIC